MKTLRILTSPPWNNIILQSFLPIRRLQYKLKMGRSLFPNCLLNDWFFKTWTTPTPPSCRWSMRLLNWSKKYHSSNRNQDSRCQGIQCANAIAFPNCKNPKACLAKKQNMNSKMPPHIRLYFCGALAHRPPILPSGLNDSVCAGCLSCLCKPTH